MQKINFNLQMAGLIPDFVYQFLLNIYVKQDSISCVEFEDLRDALKGVSDPEMADIKKFLSMENRAEEDDCEEHECQDGCEHDHEHGHNHNLKPIDEIMEEVDEDLAEVDSEYFHKYTPAELKYIFEKIVYYIDKVYKYYFDYSGVNLTLTIGFTLEGGLETNMVLEFFRMGVKIEDIPEAHYLTIKNSMVSDDIVLRVYFYCDPEKKDKYDKVFQEITDIMNVKHDDMYKDGLH
jgi:hypothetical protein